MFQNNSKRLYQCFVCGVCFKTPDEFKNHVFDKHEEGREYIKCPVKYCGWPCRDLRYHFRIRHPSCKCPESCQIRATVMYDVSSPTKRRKLPTFKEGYIISNKNNGRKMHYRSSYEKEVYDCLEGKGEVLGYEVEPFSIPYCHRGKHHHYFPDLKVVYTDGRVEIWEIKPATQTASPQNKAKFKAAELFCLQRGWKWDVITEQGIQKLKKDII